MKQPKIHPLAYVEKGAKIGNNVTVEPFAVVKQNVTLHDNVVIRSHAYIDGHTTIGENTVIYPGASIGTEPQAIKYLGERTYINIGRNCVVREYVTINSSLKEESSVEIGDNCMLMAYVHIAHNCKLGKQVVMANNATLAGHVTIEDHAIIGGMTPIHQFSRIGAYAMVGGLSRIPHDVPPYTLGAGIPFKLGGLNLVGLRRHNFSLDVRRELSRAFRLLYRSKLRVPDAIARMEAELYKYPEVLHFIDFCRHSKRGLGGLDVATEEPLEEEKELITAGLSL